MNRYYLVVIVVSLLLFMSPVIGAADIGYNWIDTTAASYSLSEDALHLPDESADNFREFSPDARQELLNMAQLYDEEEREFVLNGIQQDTQQFAIDRDTFLKPVELTSVEFDSLSGVRVNADYSEDLDYSDRETETSLNLEYQMNDRTLIRAGYGLTSREYWEMEDLKETEESQSENTETDTDEKLAADGVELDRDDVSFNQDDGDSRSRRQLVFNEEENQQGKVGISFQTSEDLVISADYVYDESLSGDIGNSRIFGLEYTDELGRIVASYEESGQQRVTGLTLDVKDLAVFSASYKLLDPDMIADRLTKEQVWDFGLNFNLSDMSSLSLGYQLNQALAEDDGEDEEQESSVKASFRIKF